VTGDALVVAVLPQPGSSLDGGGTVRGMSGGRWPANPALGISIVRLMMGTIALVAGIEKVLGPLPYGGANRFPAPQVFGYYIPAHETIFGLLILIGLATRWVAVAFIIEFFITGIVIKLTSAPPFGGYESARIDYMMLATAIALVIGGPGVLSVDYWLARRKGQAAAEQTAPVQMA
jgi:uncharacterized membrane protein YphA (DoxX/SURF4 family)